MDPLPLAEVLLLDGHADTPTAAADIAAGWLTARGVSPWAAEAARAGMVPQRAWFDDTAATFVQEHHDRARPVTAVHLPADMLTAIREAS